jgi:hypothetical protein
VPPPSEASAQRAAAEAWFLDHGLPWFVDDVRTEVTRRLERGRVVVVLATGILLGLVAGVVVRSVTNEFSFGFATWASVLGAVLLAYALWALHAKLIAGWALRRAFGSLGLLLPLATRALPMLLLFITFLFINTEVWQVASALHGGILWSSILFFVVAALGFLIPRLSQELDSVDDTLDSESLCAAAEGTPLEEAARRLCDEDSELTEGAEIAGVQKVNLVTVLVIAQAVQVVLLALAVFLFFLVFGAVAIQDSVIKSWIGHAPSYPPGPELASVELIRVSTFLAGFAGLYFTVVAITDELYRREFFSVILAELQRAVAVRVVYRRLGDAPTRGGGRPAPPAPAG